MAPSRCLRQGCLPIVACLVALVSLVAPPRAPLGQLAVPAAWAQEDPRVAAQAHYRAGEKAYAAGDYRVAIREFAAAEQLLPSGINDYNLALCYDKLGEADPAVRYYRSFLARVADTKKRATVEASIARLEAALASAQAKAEAARKAAEAEAARKAAEEQAALEARKAAEAKAEAEAADAKAKAEAEAKAKAEAEAKAKAEQEETGGPVAGPPPSPGALPGSLPSTQGAPSTKGAAAPTGNPLLDRANAIDLDAIRAERASFFAAEAPRAAATTGAEPGAAAAAGAGTTAPVDNGSKTTAKPLYKKWWFWAIVGVGTFVAIRVITQEDTSTKRITAEVPQQADSGMTLLRW